MNKNMEEQIGRLNLEIAGIKSKTEKLNEKIQALKSELVRKQNIIRTTETLVKPLLDEKNSEDVQKIAEQVLKVLDGNLQENFFTGDKK